jgi:hypothetical protein
MFSVPRAGSKDGKLEDTITTHASVPSSGTNAFTSSKLLKIQQPVSVKTDLETMSHRFEIDSLQSSLVEDDGIEPTTPCLQSRCSPS